MKVYNKTCNDVKIHVHDRYGNSYTVFIKAGRTSELDPSQVNEKEINSLINSGVLANVSSISNFMPPVRAISDVVPKQVPKVDVECTCDLEDDCNDKGEEVIQESEDVTEVPVNDREEVVETELEEVHDEVNEEKEQDVFVCPVCGNEYATKRGLTMHMNKEHKE